MVAISVERNEETFIYYTTTPNNQLCVDTWPLRKKEKRKLMIFNRKILRKIFGLVKDEQISEWRVRKNNE